MEDESWVVVDRAEIASTEDVAFITRLAEICGEHLRLVLLSRPGVESWTFAQGPVIVVPRMDESQARAAAQVFGRALSLTAQVEQAVLDAAAGNPLAIGELADELSRQGEDAEERPLNVSRRFARHAEAELARLGGGDTCRFLALQVAAVPKEYLEAAARELDLEVLPDWANRLGSGGWLRETDTRWGRGLELSMPALALALRQGLTPEDDERLRLSLGERLSQDGEVADTDTFRLFLGTSRATEALFAAATEVGEDHNQAGAVLDGLVGEMLRHRSLGEDGQELEILWRVLPLARRLGRLREYSEEIERALELSAEQPGKLLAFGALKAELEQRQGQFELAEKTIRQTLQATPSESQARRSLLLIRLGGVLCQLQRWSEAEKLLVGVLEILDREGAQALAATARFHLGNIAFHRRDFSRAHDFHIQSLRAREDVGKTEAIGASLTALGSLCLEVGRYPEALDFYSRARDVFEAANDDRESSFALLGLGRALTRIGDYTNATRPLRRALDLRMATGDQTGEALARLAVGENFLDLERGEDALDEARKAHFYLSLSDHPILGAAEQLLGRVLLFRNRPADAMRHLEAAHEIHRRQGDLESVAFDLTWMLEAAEAIRDTELINSLGGALVHAAEAVPEAARREILDYHLHRALERQGNEEDSLYHLRCAYRMLMDRTENLTADLRHRYLFLIPAHREIIDAATRRGFTLPVSTLAVSSV